MKVDDLRERAKDEGVGGTSGMKKEELVGAISQAHREGGQGSGGGRRGAAGGDAGPGEGEAGLPRDAAAWPRRTTR